MAEDFDGEYEDYYYWEPLPDDIATPASADLSARVLARLGISKGDVTLVEHYWDSGYCETCSYTEVQFQVWVDNDVVFEVDKYDYTADVGSVEDLTVFGKFNDWLNGMDDK